MTLVPFKIITLLSYFVWSADENVIYSIRNSQRLNILNGYTNYAPHQNVTNSEDSSGVMRVLYVCCGDVERSDEHHMQHKTFISDGDSSAFNSVTEMTNRKRSYGDEKKVIKAECVNHVAKKTCYWSLKCKNSMNIDEDDDDDAPPTKKKRSGMVGKNKLTHCNWLLPVSFNTKVGMTTN